MTTIAQDSVDRREVLLLLGAAGVLRTLWCYWIDNHLAKVEERVAAWLAQAKNAVQQGTSGSSNAARNFLQNHMQRAGLATVTHMTLPHAPNFQQIPLPGNPGSDVTTSSR
ncbi:hypothetical protein L209DRAFT_744048 [Thermothelomyces heterothallicus CBS 203.75]